MADFFPKAKGTEWFFKEPYVFIWLAVFLIFIDRTFSPSLASTYFLFLFASIALWAVLTSSRRHKIEINSSSGNTLASFALAWAYWFVFMLIIIVLTGAVGLIQNTVSTQPTVINFLEQNSVAFLGSAKPVLSESLPLTGLIFGGYIPIQETIFFILFLFFLLMVFKVQLKQGRFSLLKEPKFWTILFIITTLMTAYHLQAKGLSDIPLMIVAIFFFATGIIAVVPVVKKEREMETAIWFHIINNSIAVAATFSILSVFGV